jgi:tripartite ATP-independent transporter DctP family solute receptor
VRVAASAVLLAALAISSAGAGGTQDAAVPAPTARPIVMKIGHAQPVTHPRHDSLLKFKELVERRTDGAIFVNIYPAGQLGDEAAMLDATKLGALQGTRSGLFERVSPRLLVYTMPFLFDSLDGIEKVTMGPIGDRIASAAEAGGLIILTTGDAGGFRQFTNDVRPLIRPGDFVGLKMRTAGVKTIVKTLEAFGSTPVVVPYGDTYAALKSGVADGEENPFVNIEAMRFYEVQKYLTIMDYQFHPDPFVVNPAWFRSLSPEHQKILKECAIESMRYNNRLVKIMNAEALTALKNAMQVTELTTAQRQAFADKVRPVYDAMIAEGVTTHAELDEIRAVAK